MTLDEIRKQVEKIEREAINNSELRYQMVQFVIKAVNSALDEAADICCDTGNHVQKAGGTYPPLFQCERSIMKLKLKELSDGR